MSQIVIPLEFERYLRDKVQRGESPTMNEVIFAYIPGLDADQPINRENGLPESSLWVHRQDVDQVAALDENALVYSVVVPSNIETFTFNALYLRDKGADHSCGMVVHKSVETKEPGMTITKSLVQRYEGAAQLANIHVEASTWQLDYQARLQGMDEDLRSVNVDTYGQKTFIEGFAVTSVATKKQTFLVKQGIAYIGGLRVELPQDIEVAAKTLPTYLAIDVVRQGRVLSDWENALTVTDVAALDVNYVDEAKRQHYVGAFAQVLADGTIVDLRHFGGAGQLERKDNAATNADIDAYSQQEKHLKLPQFWRGVQQFVLNKLWINLARLICPVGVPLPWPTDTAPDGFAIMKGQSFSTSAYPETAKAYSNGVLPDMRGLAIVGKYDNEVILAYQDDQVKSHAHGGSISGTDLGTKTTAANGQHAHNVLIDNGGVNGNVGYIGRGDGPPESWVGGKTDAQGNHAHTVYVGAHGHGLTIAAFGAAQNTIRNRKFNWIVRLA